MPTELTGRELDVAVHRAMGREAINRVIGGWCDSETGETIPAYHIDCYPVVLDWLTGQGVAWRLGCHAGISQSKFWCGITPQPSASLWYGSDAASEAICRALILWSEFRSAVTPR